MSNDSDNTESEEPTGPVECTEWEVRTLAAAHLRSMADYIERPRATITESYVYHKLRRIEQLLSIHNDLTHPVPLYQANMRADEEPFR